MSLLMRGVHGEPVRVLQRALGVGDDGIFGAGTEAALKKYQHENGLAADGIAGPDTFSQMGLHELVLLRRGTRGETVKKLQRGLGLKDDGIFGQDTELAVRAFQEVKGVAVDGMAGPNTLALVDGFGEITPEKVEASLISESTQPVDESTAASTAAAEPKPESSTLAKIAETVAGGALGGAVEVGKSIWNTVRRFV